VRNAVEFDAFVPVSTKLGLGLAGSYNETVRADPEHVWAPPYQVPELRPVLLGNDLDEAELSSDLQDRTVDFIREHPGYPFALAYRNARRMLQVPNSLSPADAELLGFDYTAVASREFKAVYWICALAFAVVLGLAIASCLTGRARPIPAFLWALGILAVLSLVFIAGGPRYRLPLDLVLILAAAPTVAALAGAATAGSRSGSPRASESDR
jgi:hypothetical protein